LLLFEGFSAILV